MDSDKSPILVQRKKTRVFRKCCCVLRCTSSSREESMIFFPVPKSETRIKILDAVERRTWQRPRNSSLQSGIYICQKHYDLHEDVKFYHLYDPKTSDKKHPLRLKPNVLPHIFDANIEEPGVPGPNHPEYILCSERMSTYSELQRNSKITSETMQLLTEAGFFYDGESKHILCFCCGGAIQSWQQSGLIPWKEHAKNFPTCKFLQLIKGEHYVAAQQQDSNSAHKAPESPLGETNAELAADEYTCTDSVQPLLDNEDTHSQPTPSTSKGNEEGHVSQRKRDSETDLKNAASSCGCKKSRHSRHLVQWDSPGNEKSSPSLSSPSIKNSDAEFTPGTGSQASTDTCNTDFEILDRQLNNEEIRKLMLSISLENSKVFLGLDNDKTGFVKLLAQYVDRENSYRDVAIVLRRIKLYETFEVLGIHFGLSSSQVNRIFNEVLPILANCFKQYIFKSNKELIYLNLPAAFRSNYYMVTEILDCFETEIQKPSNPVHQALTWSEYKKCNTIKYLLSVQPCGHICYISEGFGGRASDMQITKSCGYLEALKKGSVALADRGFKHLEGEFADRECTLFRPPSVSANEKLSEEDSMVTKQIAALRIHVERVIGRLREFAILSPHACIDSSMLGLYDEAVIVVCGLVNLQRKITRY